MVNKSKQDDFGKKSQKKARLSGKYWRIAQEIENKKCVFCDLRDKYIVTKSKHSTLTVNIFPYIDGQLIVIPHRHVIDFSELTSDEVLDMHNLTRKGLNLLKKGLKADNVWIILRNGNIAGKTIKHLHTNIVPYKEGLNTWHYQEINISPIDLATRLRNFLKNERT